MVITVQEEELIRKICYHMTLPTHQPSFISFLFGFTSIEDNYIVNHCHHNIIAEKLTWTKLYLISRKNPPSFGIYFVNHMIFLWNSILHLAYMMEIN